MSQALSASAEKVGCSERTLRRCVNEGLLRGRRVGRRRLELSCTEEEYLAAHWGLLSELRAALRTERAARLVVLFGSNATGEDQDSSDVDLLVVHDEQGPRSLARLQMRLRRALGRPVDVVGLGQAETMPTLLADILREGRVLVDRDGLWDGLQERRREVSAAAAREERDVARRAHETVVAARERIAAAA
ncbi:MAG TPA: nucleotidyltransferase domain-containing protein [Solirubrobacteraceae bacterium]|jgi:predicted nucleotidyltransferase|nr:nucleotidyltransferase domain-containing protein [Solirubrobacteraceae bacterium]